MRTTSRFTIEVINRFYEEGRGKGTRLDYKPFHQVGRGDPPSKGLSHKTLWRGRYHHLLSNLEYMAFLFCTQLTNLVDIREQFLLSYEDSLHELRDYTLDAPSTVFDGTKNLSTRLGVKHPLIPDTFLQRKEPWPMTTDILLTLSDKFGKLYLLAISVKPSGKLTKRKHALLEIEKNYWNVRGVEWLFIKPDSTTGMWAYVCEELLDGLLGMN